LKVTTSGALTLGNQSELDALTSSADERQWREVRRLFLGPGVFTNLSLLSRTTNLDFIEFLSNGKKGISLDYFPLSADLTINPNALMQSLSVLRGRFYRELRILETSKIHGDLDALDLNATELVFGGVSDQIPKIKNPQETMGLLLEVRRGAVVDLKNLEQFFGLKALHIKGNEISLKSSKSIAELPKLDTLVLNGITDIDELSWLRQMPKLKTLHLRKVKPEFEIAAKELEPSVEVVYWDF
jgi:hypothetical protein